MKHTKKTNEEECGQECEGCPTAATCESAKGKAKGLPEKSDIDVKHVILVLSGKGGVGKSTVSVNLAFALSAHGYRTGLMDLDIHGPNVPKMLGIEDHKLTTIGNRIEPVRVTGNLAVISMAFLLPDTTTPVIWRGPMKMSAISQFLSDVDWGPLDFLVVDLPPGTGDEALSIIQLAPNVTGAVIVTTPQDVATMDAMKAAKFIEKLDIRVLGIVENMSGLVCPHCKEEIDLFGSGGGCLDEKRSEGIRSHLDPTQFQFLKKMVLDETKIDPKLMLFRVAQYPDVPLVRSDLVDKLAPHKLTGIEFCDIDGYAF